MPELPEVETVARGLDRPLTGQVIECVHLSRGDIVHGAAIPICAALRNRRIQCVRRVGKQVRIHTDRPVFLSVHLGMSGRLILVDRDQPVEPHTHLRITFRRRRAELRFSDPRRFGGIWVVNGAAEDLDTWIGRPLPPAGADPLQLAHRDLRQLLQRRRQIKALLLDQRLLGGIGNIYCDEALHRAAIHPRTLAGDLDDAAVRRLRQALCRLLTAAIKAGGSSVSDYRTAHNTAGTFQRRHRVYNRRGKPCRRCGTPIERRVVAGRGTFFCPRCQPVIRARRTPRGRRAHP